MTLTGADLKLRRAAEHIEAADEMIEAWLDSDAFRIVQITDDTTGRTDATVRIAEPPPAELALVIGDAVHNLRAALDHVVYEVAENASEGTLTEQQQGALEFPILRKRPADFITTTASRLPHVPPDAVAVIETAQPYQWADQPDADSFKHRPIWQVHELDRSDKHRRLTVTTAAVRQQGLGIPEGVDPGARFFHYEGAVTDGQVLVSYTGRAVGVTHMYDPCVVVADGGRGVNTHQRQTCCARCTVGSP